jgi:Tfp pilus assembly protein PilN
LLLTGPGAARSSLVGALQEGLGVPVRAVSLWPLVHWATPPADLSPSAAPEARRALLLDVGPAAVGIDLVDEGQPVFSQVVAVDDPEWRDSFAASQPAGGEADAAAARRHEASLRLGAALVERLQAPLFREALPGATLPGLLLTGPGAARSRLIGALQEGLGVPVRAVSPWPLVHWATPPADLSPYVAPLALALQGDGGARGLELSAERQEELHRAPSMRTTVALTLLLAGVLATHLASCGLRQQQRLALLDGEIGALKVRMEKVEGVNRRLQGQRARLGYLESAINGRARQSDILRELTGLVPDTAYLTEYSFRERTIEITGLAPSASQLLPVLEASPLFSGVEFSAPIVAQGAGLERFRIRLRLETAGG